ncbi:MFS general substrate transporter [Mrakia frigida]|uniref:MFS transporter n=1 Tax=Mrakia frigida TaxID=29902 RepID=UPI003FCC0B87
MPALKKTNINANFFPRAFPDENDEEQVENTGQTSTNAPRPPRQPSFGDSAGSDPSTQPPTRSASPAGSTKEIMQKGKKTKIILLHFEEGDPEDPLNWSKSRKWFTTFLLCMMTCLIGLSTSAYSNTIDRMTTEFGVSTVAGQVGMFTFNAACAIAPLFLAPLCELIGRREVYLTAYGLFVLCFLFLALGKNIGTEIVGRLFSGLFGSCGTILVGGTLADIWKTKERSVPMSCFTFVAIFGTIAAPVYSGYITQYIGWRWVEWVHMIANGILFIVELFFFKETRGAKILAVRAKALRKETKDESYRSPSDLESESVKDLLTKSSTRAIKLLIGEPVLFLFGFWIAMAWGITFLFLSVIPLTFAGNHGWSEGNAGLPYFGLMFGCVVGFVTGLWADRKYDAVQKENNGVAVPEYRLYGAMFFSPLLPIGLFIFSFTQYAHVHWIAPIIALVPIIVGIYHIFLATYNYTTDAYGDMSSSAIAGQGFMRNMFAASFPLFATQMFKGMGYQFAGLLLALITLALAPIPFVLFKYGTRIRASSTYAISDDEKEAEKKETSDTTETEKRQLHGAA